MASLYPEINLPTIIVPQTVRRKKYSPAPSFDFATGDFKLDSHGRMILDDGQEAFEKWCMKTCMVERGTRLAYSDKIGIEFETVSKKNFARSGEIRADSHVDGGNFGWFWDCKTRSTCGRRALGLIIARQITDFRDARRLTLTEMSS